MSFVPAPQQANAANATVNPTPNASASAAMATETAPLSDQDSFFKKRTFDVYWIDKTSLMYRDGIAKVSHGTLF
jgi:ATP-dependent RNA helicase DDX60